MLIHTFKSGWMIGRKDVIVTTGDTPLGNTTKSWSLRPVAKIVELPIGTNGVVVAFIGDAQDGGNPDGDTFSYKIFVYGENGGAEIVCTGDAIIGAQQVISTPYGGSKGSAHTGKYADTLSNTARYWPTEIGYGDNAGDNGLAKLAFDAEGCCEMFIELTDIDSDSGNLGVIPIFRIY